MVEENKMLEILLKSFPHGLFEPVAVCGLLGLVLALIMRWKKKDAFFYTLAVGISFMICWRIGIQILSSRYTSLLLFPATIGSIYLFFKLPGTLKCLPEKWRKVLPWLLFSGLIIACVAKTARINPYNDYLIRCGEYLRENAAKDDVILVYSQVQTRLEYYSGIKTEAIGPEITKNPDLTSSNAAITDMIQKVSADWLILAERKSRKIPNCELEETFLTDTGRRKKKVYVYRIEKR